MRRRRVVRTALVGVVGALVVALLTSAVLAVVFVRRPIPDREGDVTLPGLKAPVTVIRDRHAIPQIYASSPEDLFRAQGFVHAQERFFEMDLRRHVTAGRLSGFVGANADAIGADTAIRTMGWRDVARREIAGLDPATRTALQAYSDGVNDYLRGKSASQLSVSYTLLGLANRLPTIEPWQPLDSLAWIKAMAWDLRENYTSELARGRVFATVRDVGRVEQLWPSYPFGRHSPIVVPQPTTSGSALPAGAAGQRSAPAGTRSLGDLAGVLTSAAGQRALDDAQRALNAVPAWLGRGSQVGSNSWVVSGALTATGKPLLANDPHLDTSIPGIWFQIGLHCTTVSSQCPYDVAGYSFSGVPGVVIGHNARMAWGMTNLGPDVTDFYLERLDGETSYERDGRFVPLTVRHERILVAGGSPVDITVRSTVHGPLMSDAVADLASLGRGAPVPRTAPARGSGYAVSMAWTALQPGRAMDAVIKMDVASNFAEFREAALLLDTPAQNLVYADVDGHIGYQAPGRIPIRRASVPDSTTPSDGTWPQPGWDSDYDWKGYLPVSDLPFEEDPAEGFIVTANQAVAGPVVAARFTQDWDYGYRSERIRDRLGAAVKAHRPLRTSDMESIQADTMNPIAPDLVPLLLATKVDAFTASAQNLLRGWDYGQPAGSAAAAYFNAVWANLLQLAFADEMPEGTRPDGDSRWFEVVRLLLANPQDAWWDDLRTPDVVETRDEVIRKALVAARLRLTSSLGKDPTRWQWGRLHRLNLVATPLGESGSPGWLHPLFNRTGASVSGSTASVNAMAWDASTGGFRVTSGPSMRMVVDLSNLDASRWVNQTGASGHPWDSHYDDQLDAWLRGESFAWPFSRAAVDAAASGHQRLRP